MKYHNIEKLLKEKPTHSLRFFRSGSGLRVCSLVSLQDKKPPFRQTGTKYEPGYYQEGFTLDETLEQFEQMLAGNLKEDDSVRLTGRYPKPDNVLDKHLLFKGCPVEFYYNPNVEMFAVDAISEYNHFTNAFHSKMYEKYGKIAFSNPDTGVVTMMAASNMNGFISISNLDETGVENKGIRWSKKIYHYEATGFETLLMFANEMIAAEMRNENV